MIIEIEKIKNKKELFHHLVFNEYKSIFDVYNNVIYVEEEELEYIETILQDRKIIYKIKRVFMNNGVLDIVDV